jgi:hypothetical protein
MRLLFFFVIALTLAGRNTPAQETGDSEASTIPATTPVSAEDADDKVWSISVLVYTFIVPDDREYVQPTLTADRDKLHLEARYNYEDLETASIWAGYNFSGGEKFTWEVTPMLGGVFGETNGVAPGYKGSLGWWKLELYSEGEYVIDTDDSSDSFFYNWSELTLSPVDWFRFGLVTQRTRTYDSDRDIQRGLLVGFSWEQVDLCAYVLNPDDDKPVFVISAGLSF